MSNTLINRNGPNYKLKGKIEPMGEETKINYINTENYEKEKRNKFYQFTKNDLIEAEKEINVSHLIHFDANLSDDLLLYNKEDQLLNSEYQNKGINLSNRLNISSTPKIFNNNILELEEILDDKWDYVSKFLCLKDVAIFSLINKKIGKNCVLSIIEELEKEKLFYEEKLLSSVIDIFF